MAAGAYSIKTVDINCDGTGLAEVQGCGRPVVAVIRCTVVVARLRSTADADAGIEAGDIEARDTPLSRVTARGVVSTGMEWNVHSIF